jgi:LCP family protein required for cell wall assembly
MVHGCAASTPLGRSHVAATSSPSVAAVLSFLVPGLGQLSLGAIRRAVVVGLPAALTVGLLVLAVARAADLDLAGLALDPAILGWLLVANVVLAAYHVVAIEDAWFLAVRRAAPRRPGRRSVAVLAGLIVLTLGMHGYIEYVGVDAETTLDAIFPAGEGQDGGIIPPASFEVAGPVAEATDEASDATGSGQSPGPRSPESSIEGGSAATGSPSTSSPAASATAATTATATPNGPAWAADGRLNLLLVGADSGPDRWSLRTDTMILLSVDAASGRAALFGIPRNLIGVPLAPESASAFPSGHFPRLLNALYVYAVGHPNKFPGGQNRGYRAVAGAVQELVGVPLDGMIVVNLAGFVQLVDEIGGLWIDIPSPLHDRNYPLEDGSGYMTLDFSPGCQHLDGRMALAYARSRHQDSDYGRMRRQQEVLFALARNVDPADILPRVPALLRIARDNLWTTIRRSELAGLAELARQVNLRRVLTVRFVPPAYPEHLDRAEIAKIRRVVQDALTGPLPPPAPLPEGKLCR